MSEGVVVVIGKVLLSEAFPEVGFVFRDRWHLCQSRDAGTRKNLAPLLCEPLHPYGMYNTNGYLKKKKDTAGQLKAKSSAEHDVRRCFHCMCRPPLQFARFRYVHLIPSILLR